MEYRLWLAPALDHDIKVVLLPLTGDADVLVSFDPNATAADSESAAVWPMVGVGPEELVLRRDVFCRSSTSEVLLPLGCFLHLRVNAYSATTYQLGVLDARDSFSSKRECAAGCSPALLANLKCDPRCNTTACAFDRGACLPEHSQQMCSPGCESDWLGDGYCDDACFTDACGWDETDCVQSDMEGCADACKPYQATHTRGGRRSQML